MLLSGIPTKNTIACLPPLPQRLFHDTSPSPLHTSGHGNEWGLTPQQQRIVADLLRLRQLVHKAVNKMDQRCVLCKTYASSCVQAEGLQAEANLPRQCNPDWATYNDHPPQLARGRGCVPWGAATQTRCRALFRSHQPLCNCPNFPQPAGGAAVCRRQRRRRRGAGAAAAGHAARQRQRRGGDTAHPGSQQGPQCERLGASFSVLVRHGHCLCNEHIQTQNTFTQFQEVVLALLFLGADPSECDTLALTHGTHANTHARTHNTHNPRMLSWRFCSWAPTPLSATPPAAAPCCLHARCVTGRVGYLL